MLFTELELLESRRDLNTAVEKSCEEAGALVSVAGFVKDFKPILSRLLKKWSTQLENCGECTVSE